MKIGYGLVKEVQVEAEVKQMYRTQEEPRIINILKVQSSREEAVEVWHKGCQPWEPRPPALGGAPPAYSRC